MSHNITIEGGTSKRLPVAGKYCDRDIVVTATGGTPTLQNKTVTPTETAQTVTPDTGYDGLAKVDVNAIPDQYLAEAEVTAQDTLIANILTALEGKAAGGGSGGGVKTCTLQLTTETPFNVVNYSTVDDSGNVVWERLVQPAQELSLTAVCGTLVHAMISTESTMTLSNAGAVYNLPGTLKIFAITAGSGETASAVFSYALPS